MFTNKTVEFLESRRAELIAQVELLHIELQQVEAAIVAVGVTSTNWTTSSIVVKPTGARDYSIKDMVLRALQLRPEGLDLHGMRMTIRSLFDSDVEQKSLSPELSRLRAQGLLTRAGSMWRIAHEERRGLHASDAAAVDARGEFKT